MRLSLDQITNLAERIMPGQKMVAKNCAWLEACGYPGIKLLVGGPGG